jgi:hypothetical protein
MVAQVTESLDHFDAIPTLQGEYGRPRRRPDCVLGDRGYHAAAIRRGLRGRGIVPILAIRNTEHGSGLGKWRWVGGKDLRMVESVPPIACSIRKAR